MKRAKHEFLKLFITNQASLYTFVVARGIRGSDADDLLQDIATILWEKLDEYRPGTNFRAWAFTVAKYEVLTFLGKKRRDARMLNLDEETLESMGQLELHGADGLADCRKDLLVECVSRLADKARKLVQFRYGDGLPFKEIARRLRITNTALRIRMSRIRRWLRTCVRERLKEVSS